MGWGCLHRFVADGGVALYYGLANRQHGTFVAGQSGAVDSCERTDACHALVNRFGHGAPDGTGLPGVADRVLLQHQFHRGAGERPFCRVVCAGKSLSCLGQQRHPGGGRIFARPRCGIDGAPEQGATAAAIRSDRQGSVASESLCRPPGSDRRVCHRRPRGGHCAFCRIRVAASLSGHGNGGDTVARAGRAPHGDFAVDADWLLGVDSNFPRRAADCVCVGQHVCRAPFAHRCIARVTETARLAGRRRSDPRLLGSAGVPVPRSGTHRASGVHTVRFLVLRPQSGAG